MHYSPTDPKVFTAITFKKKYTLLLDAVYSEDHTADLILDTIHDKDRKSMLGNGPYDDGEDYGDDEDESMGRRYTSTYYSDLEPLKYCHNISIKDLGQLSSEELYYKGRYTDLHNHITGNTEILQLSFPFSSTGKPKTLNRGQYDYSDDEESKEDYRYKEY